MQRWLPVMFAALAFAPAAVARDGDVAVELEPSSGVPFPLELTTPGGGATHVLAGTGIRTATFVKVKVYAFGLYVDELAARSALARFADQTARDLERNQEFYDRILRRDFGLTLRLVMVRDVGGDDMAEAFDGSLRPRVQRAAAEMGMPGGEAALGRFRGYFEVGEMTKDTELVFSCTPGGTLRTTVKGETAAEVDSPALCWALFDVYLGTDPISEGGKKSVIRNFPKILTR
jgi:hypothetical protein